MKKAFSIMISLLLMLSFSGCGESKDNIPNRENNELITINPFKLGNDNAFCFDADGKYIAVLHCPIFITDFEAEEEPADLPCYLSLYDISKRDFVKTERVSNAACEVKLEKDHIEVWSDTESSCLYDYNLNYISEGTGEIFNYYSIAEGIDTIDAGRFVCIDSLAYDSNYINTDALIFYSDPSRYYITQHNNFSNIVASYEKTVLKNFQSENEDNFDLIFSAYDYETQRVINSITIKSSKTFDSFASAKINESCACFSTINENGYTDRIYCWDYNKSPENTAFECTVVNDTDFESHTQAIVSEIKEKYSVNVYVNKSIDPESFFYECKDSAVNAKYLLCLYDLKYCLASLPEELYTEMLCRDIAEPVSSFNGLNIYLVGEVADENVDAFANNLNDELYIVYGCNAFNYSTFLHEIMHNMEYRIWNYEPDFDIEWEALNPEGFEYTFDYSRFYYNNEHYQDFFARDYGMSGMLEDRATAFEILYSEEDHMQNEKEPLQKKLDYLKEVILKSYPSMNQA